MWARVVGAALGVWLMAAPAVLGYGGVAATNDRIVGPIAASLAAIAISEVVRGLRWAAVPIGVWLLLAPWLLGYGATAPVVNSVIVGLGLLALAPVGGAIGQRFGGGWSALWTTSAGERPRSTPGAG